MLRKTGEISVYPHEALRQLQNAVIRTSIADLRKDLRRWGLGLGISGNNIVIEKLEYFFDESVLLFTVGGIRGLKVVSANDLIYNEVETGYPKETHDKLNARDDFHGKHLYKLPVNRVVKKADWASEYSASIQAIEFARILFFGKDTTDSQYDERVFLIEIEPTASGGKYDILRLTGTIDGILNPDSAYNFGLSPKRALLRNAPYLLSFLQPNDIIRFQTTDKNGALETSLQSNYIEEQEDVWLNIVFGSPSKLFQPVYIEFEAVLPDTALSVLQTNPNGRVDVVDNSGNTFGIFVMELTINDATNDVFKIKGLVTPSTDITQLIR